MRNGTKRLISLLLALVMVCSLVVTPAAAAEPAAQSPAPAAEDTNTANPPAAEENTNTPAAENTGAAGGAPAPTAEGPIDVVKVKLPSTAQTPKRVYADGYQYNSPSAWAQFFNATCNPVTCTLSDGSEVELVATWKGPSEENYNYKGVYDYNYGNAYYKYTIDTLRTKDGIKEYVDKSGICVQALVVQVIAEQKFDREKTLLRGELEKFSELSNLGLPTTAAVTYRKCRHLPAETSAGSVSDTYTIVGWKMKDGKELTLDWLQNQAQNIQGNQLDIELTPVYSNAPKWATLGGHPAYSNVYGETICEAYEQPTLTLMIYNKDQATVTVNKPPNVAYGETLETPQAKAFDAAGQEITDAQFDFTYQGYENDATQPSKRTPYGPTSTPPVNAGTYTVTATLVGNDTYGGVGTCDNWFQIEKADHAEAEALVRVPPEGTTWTQNAYISNNGENSPTILLPQYEAMAKGAVIQQGQGNVLQLDDFIKSFSITENQGYFSIGTMSAIVGTERTFDLTITSDNYKEVTVHITIKVTNDNITLNGVKLKGSGTYPYGTKIENIIDLSGCSATLDGQTITKGFSLYRGEYPLYLYDAGSYEEITVSLNHSGRSYTIKHPIRFTITPAKPTFSDEDSQLINDGFYKVIYASNDEYQKDMQGTLKKLAEEKNNYYGSYGERGNIYTRVSFKPVWKWDESNPDPSRQGRFGEPYIFTATLTEPYYYAGGEILYKSENFDVSDIKPQAKIVVVPVNALPEGAEDKSISESEILQILASGKDKAGEVENYLELPCLGEYTINYTAGADDANVDGKLPDPESAKILQWYILEEGGKTRDLVPSDLKEIVRELKETSEISKTITLIPNVPLPPWATNAGIKLTITLNDPADVTVTVPDDITYGEPWEPSATAKVNGALLQNAEFKYEYEGTGDTEYGPSETKPTDAGSYKVTAKLITPGENGSGSAEFTISKATNGTTEAYISLPNGETKTVEIDEWFIKSGMAKGAKIKTAPTIDNGDLIESSTATVGDVEFTLKSKSDAPVGSSQTFTLVLVSDNYEKITVTVTVYNDNVVITGAKLKGGETEFPSGTALTDIVDLSGCTATINDSPAEGTFELMDPNQTLTGPNEYKDWSVTVTFTTDVAKYQVQVSVPYFTIKDPNGGGDEELDPGYLEKGYFIVIYADHTSNTSAQELLKLVQDTKKSYTLNGTTHNVTWSAASGNQAFQPKGYTENVWYSYTATVDGRTAEAHVRVLPVKAVPALEDNSTQTLQAADIEALTDQDWKDILSLPTEASISYTADTTGFNEEDITGTKPTSGTWPITGWRMDGKDLTLTALKAKANSASSQDVTVKLTPVYTPDVWATVTGTPTFTLTITSKIPVDVTWSTPKSFVYGTTLGELLELGKSDPTMGCSEPDQNAIGDGGTDSNGTWQYFYYKADGTTKLSSEPKDAGTYKVQAVLVSSTHSGASEMKEFTIKPKNIDSFTFTPPAGMDLTYNKQPQTPEYTVKDGEKTLVKGTDYTVTYTDNTNAGIAKVTFTGKGNYDGTKEVTFTINRCPLDSNQKPTITGTAEAREVLSASLDGVDSSELEWIWTVGVTASGITTASYAVKPQDSNKVITVTANAKTDGNYSGTSGPSEGKTVAKFTVTGTVTVGAKPGEKIQTGTTLTAAATTVPTDTGGTWSWKVNGMVKEGATSSAYTVAEGDKEIVAIFTPIENYTGTIESSVIEVGKIPLSGMVTIDDSAGTEVGDKLTASVTGGPTLEEGKTFTYTWLRDGITIDDASGSEYTIVPDDRGKTISVKVTAEGYTGERVSAGTDIPAVRPGKPTVTVTAGDEKLTISWSAPADNGGAPITGYKLKVTTGETTVLETTLAANVTSYTLENLTNGTEYTVSVQAVNRVREGDAGKAAGTPKKPETPPNPGDGGNGSGGNSGGSGGGWSGNGGGGNGNGAVNPDGSKVTVETKGDGTVVTTVQNKDGSSGVTVIAPSGQTTATVRLPSSVAGRAANGGSAVLLPVQGIYASQSIDRAPAVTINTSGVNGVKVDIPLANKNAGVVAVLVMADGTEQIIKRTIPTRNGVALLVNSGDTVKLLDNSMSFADTRGHWAADAVNFVSARGLFYGTGADVFSPNAEMTRGMLVTVLARYADVDTAGGATWYEKGAAWAVANGLSDGTNLGSNITREQLIAIMYRYAAFEGKLSDTGVDLHGYTDANRISSWAADAMSWAVGIGLIKGVTPTTLEPQGSATRAQVAAIIMRYAEMFGL